MQSIEDLQRSVMSQVVKQVAHKKGGSMAFVGGASPAFVLGGRRSKKKKPKNAKKIAPSDSLIKNLEKADDFAEMQHAKAKQGGGMHAFVGGAKPKEYKAQHAVLGGGNVDFVKEHIKEDAKDNAPSTDAHRMVLDKAVDEVLRDMDPTSSVSDVKGGNWWKDFKKGFAAPFKSIVKPVTNVVKDLDIPLVSEAANALGDVADVASSIAPKSTTADGQKRADDYRRNEAKKDLRKRHPKWSQKKVDAEAEKQLQELKKYDYKGGAKPKPKKKRVLSDKMRRRAAAVKKIMKEKGLKLIEASKYVKANNIPY